MADDATPAPSPPPPPPPPPPASEEAPAAGGEDATTNATSAVIFPKDPSMYLPIYVMTGIFGALFIIGPFFVRKGPNQGVIRCCILITAFSLWLFWFTVYVAQMNPLMGPRIGNHTLAWLAHAWGKSAVEVPPPTEGGGAGAEETTPGTAATPAQPPEAPPKKEADPGF